MPPIYTIDGSEVPLQPLRVVVCSILHRVFSYISSAAGLHTTGEFFQISMLTLQGKKNKKGLYMHCDVPAKTLDNLEVNAFCG